ncbi:MAG TPA: carbohydrate porin [Methylocella sp.]|nr:carbohydrate porin [Methylocella sp.]
MKSFFPITLAGTAALICPCLAADVAPSLPAFATNSWNGFYLGGHVGYAFGTSSYLTSPPGFPAAAGSVGLYGQDVQGEFGPLYGGLQAGYNRVMPSGLMLGFEADFSFPDEMQSNLPVAFPAAGPSVVNDKIQIFGSLRGRIGYAVGDFLLFGTGGFAYDRDLVTSTDAAGDVDRVYFWRPGWTIGGGAELRLTPDWSAKLEYAFADFARASGYFPISGERYNSNLTLQTVKLGLNYRFADNLAVPASAASTLSVGILPDLSDWSVHAQSTVVGMGNAPFPAAYTGPQSLFPGYQVVETFSLDGYLGYKAFESTEFYFNPEPFQGFGLSQTHGLAGFPNIEAQKAGFDYPHYYTARLFLRHVFGLGGDTEEIPDGPLQVAEKVDVSRITLTFGKISIPDIFDNNTYSHDGRTGFMNWALVDAGAFDYVADQKGYTWGTAVELNQKDWALRAGYFLADDVPNGNNFDMRLFQRGQYLLEFEDRYTLFGTSGKFRLTGWDTQCYCGSFAATLSNSFLGNPLLDPNAPDIAATRKTRSEFGFIANLEQTVSDDLGLFARLSWQSGQTEIMAWTDIDESASFGAVLKGTSWGRPNDKVGLAGIISGISANYEAFLAAGGLGINVGDGALSYRTEDIIETYYSVGLTDWATLAFDYQFIANPGYNYVRGPVSISAVRLHVQF